MYVGVNKTIKKQKTTKKNMNMIINLFKYSFMNINRNFIKLFSYLSINISLISLNFHLHLRLLFTIFYLIAFFFLSLLISFFKIYFIRGQLILYKIYIKKFIYNLILRFVLLKFEFFLFIYFELPSFLFKIRVFYLLSIIIINILILLSYYIYDLQFINLNIIFYLNLESNFNFLNYQLDHNLIYSIPNNENGSQNDLNMSNNNFSNNNTNPSNNPNPLGSENNAIVLLNSNQERDNEYFNNSNFNGSTRNENTDDNSSHSRFIFRASSPLTIFNEIEYDPQYDDLDFNSTVLYPYNHPWFESMVQNHIDNHSVGSVVRAINNSNNWETASKEEAILYINNKINQ